MEAQENKYNDLAVVIFSCDKNEELWQPFSYCLNKYWNNHPFVYLLTENKKNDNIKTISLNYPLDKWTKRIRESLAVIKEQYIIFICDDCFIRKQVDTERISECLNILKNNNNIALINFEKDFGYSIDNKKFKNLKLREKKSPYEISLLCGMWNKSSLINILEKDGDPWSVEQSNDAKEYDIYINSGNYIIDWGYETYKPAGIFKGKWMEEIIDFFNKENIKMDYSKKGFIERENEILSIIIPAYNTIEPLKILLDNLTYQKTKYYPETEIIVVDDGSTEDMSFLNKYNNCKIIHKENGGVSSARNIGIKAACGKYIAFIDSDDDVEKDYLHTLYKTMRKGCDYCVFQWRPKDTYQAGIQHKENLLWNWAVWGYCFKYSMIAGVLFDENLNAGEDYDWLTNIIQDKYNRIELNRVLYIYDNKNENSLSHKLCRGEIKRERNESNEI